MKWEKLKECNEITMQNFQQFMVENENTIDIQIEIILLD